jgi:antibiotic biosynthesis monooxygenase (ABM) superfamily enzyme
MEVLPGNDISFADWQAKLNSNLASFPGFTSLEFLTPTSLRKEWLAVQRFADSESAELWRQSEHFQSLLAELKSLGIHQELEESTDANLQQGVTEVIIAQVNPQDLSGYKEWTGKIHRAEAKFPGFRGVYVQSPDSQKGGRHWITLLQFDTMANLDAWLQSEERQRLLNEVDPMISSLESHRVVSPYAGWFASLAQTGELPPVWKQTMIVLLVLFPIVMLELKYLSPLLVSLNPSLATFIGNAVSVTLIAFPMMPIAIWFLGWWLTPSKAKQWFKLSLLGTLLVLGLYLIEIALFWNASFG